LGVPEKKEKKRGVSEKEGWGGVYAGLHGYLAWCGVDGVKVDGQSVLGLVMPPGRVNKVLHN
jgi:hypothetical protein